MKLHQTSGDSPLTSRPNRGQNMKRSNSEEQNRFPGAGMHQLSALKSEFDTMEESLRDALRHSRRQHHASDDKRTPPSENTITKRHNYITVYEHEPVRDQGCFRSVPNFTDNHRPVGQPVYVTPPNFTSDKEVANIPVGEFQRYCSLLMQRIQKMEEQNVELMKLAEKRKLEYQKVAAQVVESEKSQRLLLSECSSLREQVIQLANHNKKLKKQQLLGQTSHPSAQASSFVSDAISSDLLHGEIRKPLNDSVENHKDPLNRLQDHTDSLTIVQLYAALQKMALSDLQISSEDIASSANENPLPFQHIRPGPTPNRSAPNRPTNDDPDYASPSSICAAPSCTRCLVRSNSDSGIAPSHPHSYPDPGSGMSGDRKSGAALACGSLDRSIQSFDNNSYVEVELKPGLKFQADQVVPNGCHPTVPPPVSKDGWDVEEWKLPYSRDQARNGREDIESSKIHSNSNMSERFGGSLPAETENGTSDSKPSKKPTQDEKHFFSSERTKPSNAKGDPGKNPPKSNSSSMPGINHIRSGSSGSLSLYKMKKYSRSASTSDLPPPPPPPPSSSDRNPIKDPLTSSRSARRSDRSEQCDGGISAAIDLKPIRENNGAIEEEHRRIDGEDFEEENQEISAGWRRGSYSRACRKSQSFDHLCEELAAEEQPHSGDSVVPENGVDSPNPITSRVTTAPLANQSKYSDRHVPSPTFIIQESASTCGPYEMMAPVRSVKKRESESRETGNTPKSNPGFSFNSSSKPLPTKPQVSNPHNRSIACDDMDGDNMTLSLSDSSTAINVDLLDDTVFLNNREKLRNRRFSEGSAGNKQKDKLLNEAERNQRGWNPKVGADSSGDKEKNTSHGLSNSAYQNLLSQSYVNYNKELAGRSQPRFPATNPRAKPVNTSVSRAARSRNKSSESSNSSVKCDRSPKSPKASNQVLMRQTGLRPVDKKEGDPQAPKALQNVSRLAAAEESIRDESDEKSGKKKKESDAVVGGESKKKASPGGNPSKSFVSLMKAKFTRSSSSRNATFVEKSQDKALSSFPVTPATSLIDPRTLSLEPNTYLPPGKDGKKMSKQILGQNSDAAVGRKLSQPFPNGFGEDMQRQPPLSKVSEEPLSDEGFAEGSSLERSNKELAAREISRAQLHPGNEKYASSYVNVPVPRKSVERQVSGDDGASGNRSKDRSNLNMQQYENLNAKPSDKHESHLSQATARQSDISANSHPGMQKQMQTRRKAVGGEHSYENCQTTAKCDPKILAKEPYENISSLQTTGKETVQFPFTRSTSQTSGKSNFKIQSSLIGRAGKQQDAKETREAASNLMRGKELRQTKNPVKQTDFEKAFINSHVQAGLKVRQVEKSVYPSEVNGRPERHVATSSGSSTVGSGSFGTISSFGSLPSDAIESNNDSISLTFNGSSLDKSDHPPSSRREGKSSPPVEASSSFSSSGNEAGFHPKSKLPSSRVRSPLPYSSAKMTDPVVGLSYKNANSTTSPKKTEPEVVERSVLKVSHTPVKSAQINTRLTKMAPSSRLPSPGKHFDVRSGEKKVHASQGNRNPLGVKTKLRPVTPTFAAANAGRLRPVESYSRSQEPVYENCSIIARQERRK